MKNLTKKLFALTLALITVFSLTIPAFAATSSSGKSTRTITVVTKANWLVPGGESITLKQTKGVCKEPKYNWKGQITGYKTTNQYGCWDVVAKATDGSDTIRKNFDGGSLKLSLKRNKTYKITVSWDSQGNLFTELDHGSFTKLPTWKVSAKYKVSSCY